MAKYVALLRNTNLGQRGSPSRQQLEAAFLAAGAPSAASFQVNGTLVFEAPSPQAAEAMLAQALAELRAACGLAEPGCVRSLEQIVALPAAEVFAGISRALVHELTVSFACQPVTHAPALPLASPRGDAEVLWLVGDDALSVTRKVMSGPGSPNQLLEQVTGVPFTSRSLRTIERLIAAHG